MEPSYLGYAEGNKLIKHKLATLPPDQREALTEAAGKLLTSIRQKYKKTQAITQDKLPLGIAHQGAYEILWKLSTHIHLKGEPATWQKITEQSPTP